MKKANLIIGPAGSGKSWIINQLRINRNTLWLDKHQTDDFIVDYLNTDDHLHVIVLDECSIERFLQVKQLAAKHSCFVVMAQIEDPGKMMGSVRIYRLDGDTVVNAEIAKRLWSEMDPSFVPQALFKQGTPVLINNNVAGIVLFSYNMFAKPHDPHFIYRVIVDGHDLAYRCVRNDIDQTDDHRIFMEDFDELITGTKQINVLECGEDDLTGWLGSILTGE